MTIAKYMFKILKELFVSEDTQIIEQKAINIAILR